jgi:hypothetical protein
MSERYFQNDRTLPIKALPAQYFFHHGMQLLELSRSSDPGSIYGGDLGCSYLECVHTNVLQCGDRGSVEAIVHRATERAQMSRQSISSRRVTLLEGRVGVAVVELHAACLLNNGNIRACCDDIMFYGDLALHLPLSECEVLYGRSGWLHAVAAAKSALKSHPEFMGFADPLCDRVISQIYAAGLQGAQQLREAALDSALAVPPLCWMWHDKAYLGACHGVSGILYTLLLFPLEVQTVSDGKGLQQILETLDWLMTTCTHPITGNLASSIAVRPSQGIVLDPRKDKLVQWCHGPAGTYIITFRNMYLLS